MECIHVTLGTGLVKRFDLVHLQHIQEAIESLGKITRLIMEDEIHAEITIETDADPQTVDEVLRKFDPDVIVGTHTAGEACKDVGCNAA